MPRATRTPSKSAGKQRAPQTVPQKHGGALLPGGKLGNKGGTGRPPEALRIRSREVFAAWLDWAAKQMAHPDKLDPQTLNVIGNTAAKYGLGTTTESTVSGPQGAPLAVSVTHRVVDPSGH